MQRTRGQKGRSADARLARRALEATGLQPIELAERMETTKVTVYRWIRGEDPPRGPARVLLRLFADHPEVVPLLPAGETK